MPIATTQKVVITCWLNNFVDKQFDGERDGKVFIRMGLLGTASTVKWGLIINVALNLTIYENFCDGARVGARVDRETFWLEAAVTWCCKQPQRETKEHQQTGNV